MDQIEGSLRAVLNRHKEERNPRSVARLAKQTGIPESTLKKWFGGEASKPHRPDGLLKLASVWDLNEIEVDELLLAGNQPQLAQLRQIRRKELQALLLPWPPPTRPFRATPDLPFFTGREAEIETLKQRIFTGTGNVFCIFGMHGVGKTALASHLAHLLDEHFTDGVLWANMANSDPAAKLIEFAHAYDLDLTNLPDLDSRSGVVREFFTTKRVLIILDDVQSSPDIEPFLPATDSSSIVLITSRREDLYVAAELQPLYLVQFSENDSLTLFAKVLGKAAVRAPQEKAALINLASFLGYLPFAIDLTARQLRKEQARKPTVTAAEFLARLQQLNEQPDRFGETLSIGERSLAGLFQISYSQLSPHLQEVFLTLGAFLGESFDSQAVAKVSGLTITETVSETLLQELKELSLVKQVQESPPRYTLHDLIRAYIAYEANNILPLKKRMVDYYVSFTQANERNYGLLGTEQSNIRAALRLANELTLDEALIWGGIHFCRYLDAEGLYDEAEARLSQIQAITDQRKNPAEQAAVLNKLGRLKRVGGDYAQAKKLFEQALPLALESGRPEIICETYEMLGVAIANLGDLDTAEKYLSLGILQAREHVLLLSLCDLLQNQSTVKIHKSQFADASRLTQEYLETARVIGNRERESAALTNLASIKAFQGHDEQALPLLEESLQLARLSHNRAMIVQILNGLSSVETALGLYAEAHQHLLEALPEAGKLRNFEVLNQVLRNLGNLADMRGRWQQSDAFYQEALAKAKQIQNQLAINAILCDWGKALLRRGEWAKAATAFEGIQSIDPTALAPEPDACRRYGLAQLRFQDGDVPTACQLAREALVIYSENGYEGHAAEVEAWLSENCPASQ